MITKNYLTSINLIRRSRNQKRLPPRAGKINFSAINIFKALIYTPLIIFFSVSCASSSFSCKAPGGVSCVRVSDTLEEGVKRDSDVKSDKKDLNTYNFDQVPQKNKPGSLIKLSGIKTPAYKTSSKNIRFVIFPWIDLKGRHHEGDVITTEIPGKFFVNNDSDSLLKTKVKIKPPVRKKNRKKQ